MSKPTTEEKETALKMAANMRDKNVDPFFIAKTLLNHNYRIKHLEDVLSSADRYINCGMSEQERLHLIRSIEKAKQVDSNSSGKQSSSFGLE